MRTLKYSKPYIFEALMEVYDQNADLQHQLEEKTRRLEEAKRLLAAGAGGMGAVDLKCLDRGRKMLFEDATASQFYYLRILNSSGEVITSFEQFRDDYTRKVPDFMSKNEFYKYFDPEFRAAYQEKMDEDRAKLSGCTAEDTATDGASDAE